jgi:tRNA pseudouridine13 synthase
VVQEVRLRDGSIVRFPADEREREADKERERERERRGHEGARAEGDCRGVAEGGGGGGGGEKPRKLRKVEATRKTDESGSQEQGEGLGEDGEGEGVDEDTRGRYVRFILALLGEDTISAVRKLADACGAPYSAFRFAGIKDKYAITLQEVTVDTQMVDVQQLLRADKGEGITHRATNSQKRGPVYNIRNHIKIVGKESRCAEHLHSGELLGNRFTIVVRNISASDRDVERAVSRLRTDGFVNYFGMQRFGSGAVPSVAAGNK